MSYFAHPSAVIDSGAKIGSDSKIWHFSHVMSGATIGTQCIVGQNCFIGNKVDIGNRVKIQNNVSVYEGVSLADEVFVGPSVVFTNVLTPRAFIERKHEFAPTPVGQGASIGANATIVCGNRIGEYAMVGAGSVVTNEVRPYELVAGVPARHMGWVSKAGKRLHFGEDGFARCSENSDLYQLTDSGVKVSPE